MIDLLGHCFGRWAASVAAGGDFHMAADPRAGRLALCTVDHALGHRQV